MDKDKGKGQLALELLMILAVNLLSVWAVLPAQEKMWIKLNMRCLGLRVLAVLAMREGRAGMGDELKGRDPSLRYGSAFRLSVLRDRLAATRP